jgi:ubiquinol-cytochrome c reductase cytochrome c subunit
MRSTILARMRGRAARAVVLAVALGVVGVGYATLSPASNADNSTDTAAEKAGYVAEGQKLFNEGCISCHGRNAEGVKDRGPSLIGVGAASAEFQLSTGRMPLAGQSAQAKRGPASYNADEIAQIAAYIQSLGGGPELPAGTELADDQALAEGGVLFRTNCASCHSFSAAGGALSGGKFAPKLSGVTDRQLYAAMLTGPQNMPVFGDNQLTPEQKRAIIAYVQNMDSDKDPGGAGIGRTGPVPEGLVIFGVGIVFLVLATVWIAGKS